MRGMRVLLSCTHCNGTGSSSGSSPIRTNPLCLWCDGTGLLMSKYAVTLRGIKKEGLDQSGVEDTVVEAIRVLGDREELVIKISKEIVPAIFDCEICVDRGEIDGHYCSCVAGQKWMNSLTSGIQKN